MNKSKDLRTNVSLALQRKKKSACIVTKHAHANIYAKSSAQDVTCLWRSRFHFQFLQVHLHWEDQIESSPFHVSSWAFWREYMYDMLSTKNFPIINIFAKRKSLFACMYVTDRKTSTKAGISAVILFCLIFSQNDLRNST